MDTKFRNSTKPAGKLRILLADSHSFILNDTDRFTHSASQAESARYASPNRAHSIVQLESSLSRALTAAALRIYLGRKPSPEDLSCELRIPGDKPRFPAYPDFHYNISHSGGVAVCGLSDHPIGIDLQKIPDDPRKILRIAKRFFSSMEQENLQILLDQNEPEAFCRLFCRYWTSRESYIKLTGRGLAESFGNYRPDLEKGMIQILHSGSPNLTSADSPAEIDISSKSGKFSETVSLSDSFYITECPAPEGYCLTVCSTVPLPSCEAEKLSFPLD